MLFKIDIIRIDWLLLHLLVYLADIADDVAAELLILFGLSGCVVSIFYNWIQFLGFLCNLEGLL